MRLEDESAALREAFPAEYAELVLAVTELGGTTVPMVLLAVLFWLSSRRRNALVISYAVAGIGFVVAVKAALGLPRPPSAALLVPLEIDGFGFPSGHAFASVVVYGGLVAAYDRVRDPRAVLALAVVVAAVSLSRVFLGVHYLGDVLAGIALGVGFLAIVGYATRDDPRVGFAIALPLGVVAIVVTGASGDALLAFGGSIGGLAATVRGVDRSPVRSRFEAGVLVAIGLCGLVAVRMTEGVVSSPFVLVGLYALLSAWVLLVPGVVGRIPLERLPATAT
ncbi:phosphatase PAP2 family protein [Natrarchaeobius chitinivorans]|uniref:Phosphatase PAP2 family protein n=1 Tax=Natrarchaeobius chitinivorans TaxID=1679083 RepID=A0A3N6M6J1_NATCH|nr:phosphatase PAP2 family protein [Natrarchaeobius chitinivorans]RQG97807.1 phosphatase PAP2 family protein [Natrarchaeobius chitinivorans]